VPICPRCRSARVDFEVPECENCRWRAGSVGDIPDFLDDADRQGVFGAYTELYEQIAADDLNTPIQEDELLDLEAIRVLEALGPVRGLSVCEVGIGRGLLFERLRSLGPKLLVGVDLAWPYLTRARADDAGVRVVRANAENLPFREEIDAMVASDVMEHVLNPADFLHSAIEALVPGGRLLVKVPFRENISQYRRSSGCRYPMVHLRTFDRPLLRQILEDAGLKVQNFSYSGFYLDRWQPALARLPGVAPRVKRLLEQLYGADPGPNRMHPRAARLLMRPVVITALARKPS
jgi:SAM-dependent methyltransferase